MMTCPLCGGFLLLNDSTVPDDFVPPTDVTLHCQWCNEPYHLFLRPRAVPPADVPATHGAP
jgi:hypothetical protein